MLEADRQTIFLKGPIATSQSVRILANGSVYIPPQGTGSSASLSTTLGPFDIQNCVGVRGDGNEVLTLTSAAGSATVRLPMGPRVNLEDVKNLLLMEASHIITCSETSGAFVLTENKEIGSLSTLTLSGKGADSLGFVQKRAMGRQVYPPWVLVGRPNQLPTLSATGAPQDNPPLKTPLPSPSPTPLPLLSVLGVWGH